MKVEHLVRCEVTVEGMVFLAQLVEAFPLPVVLAIFPTIQDVNLALTTQGMIMDDLLEQGILEQCDCCGTTIYPEIREGLIALGTPEIILEGRFFHPRSDGSQEVLRWVGAKKNDVHVSVVRDESGMLCMDVLQVEDWESEITPVDIFYPIISGIIQEMGFISPLKFVPHSIEDPEEIDRESMEFLQDADNKFVQYYRTLYNNGSQGYLTLMEYSVGKQVSSSAHTIEMYVNEAGVGVLSYAQKTENSSVRHFTPLTKQYLRQALEKIIEYTCFETWFKAYRK